LGGLLPVGWIAAVKIALQHDANFTGMLILLIAFGAIYLALARTYENTYPVRRIGTTTWAYGIFSTAVAVLLFALIALASAMFGFDGMALLEKL
jgi:hypothetical protein